jgi:hypothetical protein
MDGGLSEDLTLSFAPAYRFSVTRCRRVPHVHVTSLLRSSLCVECVGGRCRPKPQLLHLGFDQLRPSHRAIWPKHRRDPSLTNGEKS